MKKIEVWESKLNEQDLLKKQGTIYTALVSVVYRKWRRSHIGKCSDAWHSVNSR